MAALLDVKNLSVCVKKEGKTLKILDNISFSIDVGEILGLAGESGCGKSMTALSITNLLPQGVIITEGNIFYNSRDLTALSEKEMCGIRGSEISVIFQDVRQSLNPLMKIGLQITETLDLQNNKQNTNDIKKTNQQRLPEERSVKLPGTNKAQKKEKVMELLENLGFEDPEKIYKAYPHQLSGGMCQKIMTAIAVISRPKLLLADEPSSSLDEESQNKCISLLLDRNKDYKISLLIISHDLSIIQKYCSRYLIMYSGKIVEEGPASALFSPLHPYTHALVNAIPHKDKKGRKLEHIPGKVPSIDDQLSGCPFAPRCPKVQKICREKFPQAIETGNGKVYCYFPETIIKNH